MKHIFLLLLLVPMACCVKGQINVTLNLPDPCSSVGIKDSKIGGIFDFSVSPNPADNQFKLSIEASEQIGSVVIKIFNAQGSLVYNENIFSKNHTVIKTINTKNLSGGLYMISVQGKKGTQTKTIVLNKN